MIKMPLARAKAADASLPTLVEEGKVCLRIRRTHASGGSNSTADGGPLFCCLFSLSAVAGVAITVGVVAAAGAAAGEAGLVGLMVGGEWCYWSLLLCGVIDYALWLECGAPSFFSGNRILNKHPDVLERG